MAKSLQEYVEWLDSRDTLWPKLSSAVPVKATPYLKPLAGIRAVTWSVYGTLLRIADGQLLFDHPQELRMQVAFEKTIREFNMWHSMTRKPGEPWKQLYEQYKLLLEKNQMAGTKHKGDVIEIDVRNIWRTIVTRLEAKEYTYDRSFFGDRDELADKIAWFFHANLQGTEAASETAETLSAIVQSGRKQSLLADGQAFTFAQLLRALQGQATLPPPGDVFAFDCLTLSFQENVRKPSKSIYRNCLSRFEQAGISPGEILHVGSRLRDDLAIARQFGMRTALYAGDITGFKADKQDVLDPSLRPDRLITSLGQIRDILRI